MVPVAVRSESPLAMGPQATASAAIQGRSKHCVSPTPEFSPTLVSAIVSSQPKRKHAVCQVASRCSRFEAAQTSSKSSISHHHRSQSSNSGSLAKLCWHHRRCAGATEASPPTLQALHAKPEVVQAPAALSRAGVRHNGQTAALLVISLPPRRAKIGYDTHVEGIAIPFFQCFRACWLGFMITMIAQTRFSAVVSTRFFQSGITKRMNLL
jgi:hypothetical protein